MAVVGLGACLPVGLTLQVELDAVNRQHPVRRIIAPRATVLPRAADGMILVQREVDRRALLAIVVLHGNILPFAYEFAFVNGRLCHVRVTFGHDYRPAVISPTDAAHLS